MKEIIIRKLTSRKFWLAVAGFVTAAGTASGADPGTVEKWVSVIMAGAVVIGYIVGEGLTDSAGAGTVSAPDMVNAVGFDTEE